jgi:hypothetical protein
MSDDHHGRRTEEQPCWPEPWTRFSARASGHRTIFCWLHTFGSSGGGRIASTAFTLHDHEVSLEY